MRIIVVKKRTLLFILLAVLLGAAAIAAVLLWGGETRATAFIETNGKNAVEEYELNVLAGKKRELPVYSVEREDKRIALTVDAAWEDDKTAFILDTLDKYKIKATFFLCGVWVNAYPEDVKEIAARGHEVGNHSLTHPHMNKQSAADIQKEISDLDDLIEKLTGKRCTLFRAPYGEYNDTVITAVRDIGYEPIQWNIDTVVRVGGEGRRRRANGPGVSMRPPGGAEASEKGTRQSIRSGPERGMVQELRCTSAGG